LKSWDVSFVKLHEMSLAYLVLLDTGLVLGQANRGHFLLLFREEPRCRRRVGECEEHQGANQNSHRSVDDEDVLRDVSVAPLGVLNAKELTFHVDRLPSILPMA
jgi:hypothetical protein